MHEKKYSKIIHLLNELPHCAVITSRWLSQQGYSSQLVKHYSDAGWLKKIANGVYVRLGDPLIFSGALAALQNQLLIPIHLGGLSAINRHKSSSNYYLFNTTKKSIKLPLWFSRGFPEMHLVSKQIFDDTIGIEYQNFNGFQLAVARPERAIMEILAGVTDNATFFQAHKLMQHFANFDEQLVIPLLQACLSIKVKRLFLYFSEQSQLPYRQRLDTSHIHLGQGMRIIGEGGRYIAKYQLLIPTMSIEQEMMYP